MSGLIKILEIMPKLAFNTNGNVLSPSMNETINPIEITKCKDTGLETASFSFYDGKHFLSLNKHLNLKQTTSFEDVRNGTHFIVCAGDIMVKVNKFNYPHITRRNF